LAKVYNIAVPGVLFDEDGKPLPGAAGLGIGAVPIGGKSKDTSDLDRSQAAEPVGNAYGHWTTWERNLSIRMLEGANKFLI
jgi:filamentous hemagglutinin